MHRPRLSRQPRPSVGQQRRSADRHRRDQVAHAQSLATPRSQPRRGPEQAAGEPRVVWDNGRLRRGTRARPENTVWLRISTSCMSPLRCHATARIKESTIRRRPLPLRRSPARRLRRRVARPERPLARPLDRRTVAWSCSIGGLPTLVPRVCMVNAHTGHVDGERHAVRALSIQEAFDLPRSASTSTLSSSIPTRATSNLVGALSRRRRPVSTIG
jgi:hypothetical protein